MTLNELKESVMLLGFERDIESLDSLVVSANRALRILFTERPVYKSVWVSTHLPPIREKYENIPHAPGDRIALPLGAGAYSFFISGKGAYTLTDGDTVKMYSFDKTEPIHRGIAKRGGSICFEGEHFYLISSYCTFDGALSDQEEDIPVYKKERRIDLRRLCPDFMALKGMPYCKSKRRSSEISVFGEQIILPFEFEEDLRIDYARLPEKIKKESPNARIDLPSELEELLPLLCASFLWLDDDAQKAQYYMALYRDILATLKRSSVNILSGEYSSNGWA